MTFYARFYGPYESRKFRPKYSSVIWAIDRRSGEKFHFHRCWHLFVLICLFYFCWTLASVWDQTFEHSWKFLSVLYDIRESAWHSVTKPREIELAQESMTSGNSRVVLLRTRIHSFIRACYPNYISNCSIRLFKRYARDFLPIRIFVIDTLKTLASSIFLNQARRPIFFIVFFEIRTDIGREHYRKV